MKKSCYLLLALVLIFGCWPMGSSAEEQDAARVEETGVIVQQETIVQPNGTILEMCTVVYPTGRGNYLDGS